MKLSDIKKIQEMTTANTSKILKGIVAFLLITSIALAIALGVVASNNNNSNSAHSPTLLGLC